MRLSASVQAAGVALAALSAAPALASGQDVPPPDTIAPTAVPDGPRIVGFGESFSLDGARSFDPGGGAIVEYRWSGVVEPVALSTPALEVAAGLSMGEQVFTLVVVDAAGNESLPAGLSVEVVDASSPTALVDAPSTVDFGQQYSLDGGRSFDAPGGTIVEYRWSGALAPTVTSTPSVQIRTGDTTGPGVGTHVYTLVVVDAAGNVSRPTSTTVEVRDASKPTAVLHGPRSVALGESFSLDGARSFDLAGGAIVEYRWSGAVEDSVTSTPTLEVLAGLPPTGLGLGTHAYTLVVVDAGGNASQPASISVEVQDRQAPTAVIHGPPAVEAGQPLALDGTRSFDAGGGTIVEYLWSGDIPPTVTTQAGLTVPVALTPGVYTFVLTVRDQSGNQSLPSQTRVEVLPASSPEPELEKPAPTAGALLRAIRERRSDSVEELLSQGAVPTPFHLYVALGIDPRSAHHLIGHGLDPNVVRTTEAGRETGAVAYFCAAKDVEAVALLLSLGAEPDYRGDGQALTALMEAARAGSADLVRRLLEAGADRDARDGEGNTALDWATKGGSEEVVKLLGG